MQDTISGFDHKAGLVEKIDDKKTSQDLKNAINNGKKIIITTLQKFPVIFSQVDDTTGRKFAVIVDEAHSSQTGSSAKKLKTALADTTIAKQELVDIEEDFDEQDEIVQQLLTQGQHKNLSFFAFTATPKEKTIEMFGVKQPDGTSKPFHIYSIRQAIEEGFAASKKRLKNNIIMDILNQLSSQKGDKTEIANRLVAEKCIANEKILADIALGLEDNDRKLQSDCIEVFTFVAEVKPEFVVPYAESILPLLYSKETYRAV